MFEIIKGCKALAGEDFTYLPDVNVAKFVIETANVNLNATVNIRWGKIASLVLSKQDNSSNSNLAVIISQTRPSRRPKKESKIFWAAGHREDMLLEHWLAADDSLHAVYYAQIFLHELEVLVKALESGVKSKEFSNV